MRIGIDCRTILNPGKGEQAGVGHYTYYLITSLIEQDTSNTYLLFFDSRFTPGPEFHRPHVVIRSFPFYQYKKYLPIAYSQMLITAMLNRERLDVFHAPANTMPLPYTRPAVVTVHDLAIYKFPKLFPKTLLNRQSLSTRVLVPRSLIKAERIIAISKNTKTDIIEEFGVPVDKVDVVYEGVLPPVPVDDEKRGEVCRRYGLQGNYLLFIGTVEPRKNIELLIKAFRDLKLVYGSPLQDYQLAIAGARGWKDESVFAAIADANASILGVKVRRSGEERRSGHDGRPESLRSSVGDRRHNNDRRRSQPIKHLGYIPHADKLALISGARCFVFPSLYEGFGLPLLEAMSYGVPVITSDVSSLPEVSGAGGLLIDPRKESDLEDAIQQIVTDDGLHEKLSVGAREQAKQFTWQRCAQETLAVYQRVYDETHAPPKL